MTDIDKIKINNVEYDIAPTAANVGYTNVGMQGVTNAKQALDYLNTAMPSGSSSTVTSPIYKNNPLPVGKSTLKILAIGNSFTIDPTAYFSRLLSASGISESAVCLYSLQEASCSLNLWSGYIDANSSKELSWRGGTCDTDNSTINAIRNNTAGSNEYVYASVPCQTALHADWDIVVVQQYSNYASWFTNDSHPEQSFNPYLRNIVMQIRRLCTNPAVCIAFQQAWKDTLAARSAVIKKMIAYNGIDIIIPTFAALQNAVNTNTFDGENYYRQDGHHLGWGLGKYVAACTWWETLVAPVLGESILGNSCTITSKTAADPDNTGVAVTDDNKELCQMCAIAAVTDMYNVTDLSNFEPTNS